jgi:hypothetical protein
MLALPRRPEMQILPEIDGRMRIGDFWTLYGDEMGDPESKTACDKVAAVLRTKHGKISVDGMMRMIYSAIVNIVKECGGNENWVKAIEELVGARFERLAPGAPESAIHGEGCQVAMRPGTNEAAARCANPAKSRYGQELFAAGRIEEISPPLDEYVGTVITETDDPVTKTLSYLDTKNVVEENLKYMACVHGYVSGDKFVFQRLAKLCKQQKWTPYTLAGHQPATWFKKHKERFKNSRKTIAKDVYPKLRVSKENAAGLCSQPRTHLLNLSPSPPRPPLL